MKRRATDFYGALVRAYRLQELSDRPNHPRAGHVAGVDLRTCKRAWDLGYPPTRAHERLPPIRVLFDPRASVSPGQLDGYLTALTAPEGEAAATPPPAPSAVPPAPQAAPAASAAGLASLLPAPAAAPAPTAPPKSVVVYVGSDASERRAVDAGRTAATGAASIAIQILAGLEPYAKTIRAKMAMAAEHATHEDATFALSVLDKTSGVIERMAGAIEKLSRVTSVLDGRASEIHRHETAAPAPATPAEIAATAKAVLAEVRLWQEERDAEDRDAAAIDVTPAEPEPAHAQLEEGASDARA